MFGGVYRIEFFNIIFVGVFNIFFDMFKVIFDNRIVIEYVFGNIINFFVVGLVIVINCYFDFKVFNSDGNVIINIMILFSVFQSICQIVLQKMIDVVLFIVILILFIVLYIVKLQDMQFIFQFGGVSFFFIGKICVWIIEIFGSIIINLVLIWKDRNGGNSCGFLLFCFMIVIFQGIVNGFDDIFVFFLIEVIIFILIGIFFFIIIINCNDGLSQIFDNNGNIYFLLDVVVL